MEHDKYERKVVKWGNSIGVRLPYDILQELDIKENDSVTIFAHNGSIVISPANGFRMSDQKKLQIATRLLNEVAKK